jgi:hypothetical protein
VGNLRADPDKRPWVTELAQGYGPFVAILLLLVAAAVVVPMRNVIEEAPPVVTEADLATLRAAPMAAGAPDSQSPDLSAGRRGYWPACTRDHAAQWLAETLHLPDSQRRRVEYALITDCRLTRR